MVRGDVLQIVMFRLHLALAVQLLAKRETNRPARKPVPGMFKFYDYVIAVPPSGECGAMAHTIGLRFSLSG